MLLAFKLTPASATWAQWASVFMIGFFLYGPQVDLQDMSDFLSCGITVCNTCGTITAFYPTSHSLNDM